MLEEMASLIHDDMKPSSPVGSNSDKAYNEEEEADRDDDSDSDDDFGGDRDVHWNGALNRRKSKSPMRGAAPQKQPSLKNRLQLEHSLQTIPEDQSEAENTFAGTKVRAATPGNGQDTP